MQKREIKEAFAINQAVKEKTEFLAFQMIFYYLLQRLCCLRSYLGNSV